MNSLIKIIASVILIMPCVVSAQTTDTQRMLQSSRNATATRVTWEQKIAFEFDSPAELDSFPVAAGKFEIRNGALRAIEGPTNRAIMLAKNKFGNYVRVEMDVTNLANPKTGRTGDISFLLNSVPVEKYEVFFFNGYSLTTASFANSNSAFYKKGKPLARTEYTPVVPGKKNKAVLEYMNGHIRYWLNDQIILECWDDNPLQMDPELWIGIRSYDTEMVVDRLTISSGKPL